MLYVIFNICMKSAITNTYGLIMFEICSAWQYDTMATYVAMLWSSIEKEWLS